MLRFSLFLISLLFCLSSVFAAEETVVDDIFVGANNKIIIDLKGANIDYDYFELDKPARLVVDIKNGYSNYIFNKDKKPHNIRNISQQTLDGLLRIVIEFYAKQDVLKVALDKVGHENYALSYQMTDNFSLAEGVEMESIDEIIDVLLQEEVSNNEKKAKITTLAKKPTNQLKYSKNKQKVIIIDAGHGGKDPGAIGYNKVKEKNITLDYAKYLYDYLKKNSEYKVYLTRNNDVFLTLGERNRIARKYNADLFISLHADAATNRNARGFSIYTLSDKASDIEAAKLAKKENYSDVISGVDLTGVNNDVKTFLIDLSQEHGKAESKIFADILIKNMKTKVNVRGDAARFAGFAVLKNTNMASVLIELGFVTNNKDSKMLKSGSYRKDITVQIKKSIDEYFALSR